MTNKRITVEKFTAWLEVTEAVRKQQEIENRAVIVDVTLRDVSVRINWGLMSACDHVWTCRGMSAPPEVRCVVEETLQSIGWVHPGERAAKK